MVMGSASAAPTTVLILVKMNSFYATNPLTSLFVLIREGLWTSERY